MSELLPVSSMILHIVFAGVFLALGSVFTVFIGSMIAEWIHLRGLRS